MIKICYVIRLLGLFVSLIILHSCAGDIVGPPGPDGTTDAIFTARRPMFLSSQDGSSQVTVPATEASPAKVFVGGMLLTNKNDVAADLDVSGRGGLDRGVKEASSAYYLYAIPDETEATFDLVISVNPPSSGPNGFSEWSYLGAFLTDPGKSVIPIFSLNGFATIEDYISAGGSSPNVNSTTWVSKAISPYPVTVTRHWGALELTGGGTDGGAEIKGSSDTPTNSLVVRFTANGNLVQAFGFVPAFDGANVWIQVSHSSLIATWQVYGWEEDLLRYP